MQELSTTSILSLFETNKEQRKSFVSEILDKIQQGASNPLTVHLQLKCVEDIIKQLTSNDTYKSELLSAAEKYSGKSFNYQNAKFERKEVGVKYDYSQCNDPVISELEQQSAELNERLKARQKFLQTVPLSGVSLVIEETGETVTVYPPSKSSTSSVAVTLL